MRVLVTEPLAESGLELLRRDFDVDVRRDLVADLAPVMRSADLLALQARVADIHASDALVDYVQAVTRYTRAG